jgi:hypothetical protein
VTKRGGKTRPCNPEIISARLQKAGQFYDAAEAIRESADDEAEVGDAYVTLLVHAGIAAADVICCAALGRHAQGDDHQEAVSLLQQVAPEGKELGNSLNTLLGLKTRAGYSSTPVTREQRTRAQRATRKLLDDARQRKSP